MGEEAVHGAAFALQNLDDLAGQLVDVVRRKCLEQRFEAVEQVGQVERGRGAVKRDFAAGRQETRGGAAFERDVALPDHVAVLDDRADVRGEPPAAVERESDQCVLVVGDLQLFHLPDPDPGDPHVVADVQRGRVEELRPVRLGVAEAGVGDGDREDHRGGGGDQDEDQALDQRGG